MKINKTYLFLFIGAVVFAAISVGCGISVCVKMLESWKIWAPMIACAGLGVGFSWKGIEALMAKIQTVSLAVVNQALSSMEATDKENFSFLIIGIICDAATIGLAIAFLIILFDQWRVIVTGLVFGGASVALVFVAIWLMKKTIAKTVTATPAVATPTPTPAKTA
jgi:MFS family permease